VLDEKKGDVVNHVGIEIVQIIGRRDHVSDQVQNLPFSRIDASFQDDDDLVLS
jgi:hypothetical protein